MINLCENIHLNVGKFCQNDCVTCEIRFVLESEERKNKIFQIEIKMNGFRHMLSKRNLRLISNLTKKMSN